MLEMYMQPAPIYITCAILLALAVFFFVMFIKANRKRKLKYDAAMAKYKKAMDDLEKSKEAKTKAGSSVAPVNNGVKSYDRCILFMSATGSTFDVPMNDVLSIGKNSRCNFHINDSSLADLHCKILYKDGKYYLQDLGSDFGTSYDGERVAPKSTIEIKNGLIQFGKVSFMMTLD